VFLASQESSFVNGETLGVTGGQPLPKASRHRTPAAYSGASMCEPASVGKLKADRHRC
jgi:hypothetical protein